MDLSKAEPMYRVYIDLQAPFLYPDIETDMLLWEQMVYQVC